MQGERAVLVATCSWDTGGILSTDGDPSVADPAHRRFATWVRPIDDRLVLPEVFTTRQAAAAGVSPKQLRGPGFTRVLTGAYVSARVEVTERVRAVAALLVVPDGLLSHRSAAAALRLPTGVFEGACTTCSLSAAPETRHRQRPGLVIHRASVPLDQRTPTAWGAATSAARTFLDRAAELCFEDLVALGDEILRRQLARPEELARVVAWGTGRRGAVQARRALGWLNPGAASPMESWARVRMLLGGLPHPELNAVLRDRAGGWLASGDFVWRAARLVVEYDGVVHLPEAARRADARRRALLTAEGWTVVTITADDVLRRPDAMVALIGSLLAAAA